MTAIPAAGQPDAANQTLATPPCTFRKGKGTRFQLPQSPQSPHSSSRNAQATAAGKEGPKDEVGKSPDTAAGLDPVEAFRATASPTLTGVEPPPAAPATAADVATGEIALAGQVPAQLAQLLPEQGQSDSGAPSPLLVADRSISSRQASAAGLPAPMRTATTPTPGGKPAAEPEGTDNPQPLTAVDGAAAPQMPGAVTAAPRPHKAAAGSTSPPPESAVATTTGARSSGPSLARQLGSFRLEPAASAPGTAPATAEIGGAPSQTPAPLAGREQQAATRAAPEAPADVRLTVGRNDALAVTLSVSNAGLRDKLAAASGDLRADLARIGTEVEAISVEMRAPAASASSQSNAEAGGQGSGGPGAESPLQGEQTQMLALEVAFDTSLAMQQARLVESGEEAQAPSGQSTMLDDSGTPGSQDGSRQEQAGADRQMRDRETADRQRNPQSRGYGADPFKAAGEDRSGLTASDLPVLAASRRIDRYA